MLLSILESQKLSAVADEAYLAADSPLSIRPGESQTLSAVLLDPLLLMKSSVSFFPPTEPLSPSVQLIPQLDTVFQVLFYAELSMSSLLSVVSDLLSMIYFQRSCF